ncbi:MAG TPA: tRNA uridine-5-carboxymethylaminomethyl(34) synthesis GTPase MnmE [Alphaproteobacteria bacterium]|nr:tRNA uridine-5-carboxymethylaminomethyl(34) synthesis GTPase MnmE [Alphaproteobacteria bacterium]
MAGRPAYISGMVGERDTIYAPATAAGRASIAVVRISGPRAGAALEALTARPPPQPRHATRARFIDPGSGEAIDEGLVLWFSRPRSFTGEDVAELHLHGSRAVLSAALAALAAMPGLRLAAAGEFTRRAFDAGKLDLAEVEGLADLIAAETEAQRRQALRQLSGELGRLTEAWRDRVMRALARAEAEIDFPDEDVPGGMIAALGPVLADIAAEIRNHLDDNRRGERLRDGVQVAIVGPPNAGKSSLLNRLARREAAIVSATAGTTRDVVEVQLDLAGYPVVVADTAGLRDLEGNSTAQDEIEREGMRRALARAQTADLKILVLDATQAGVDPAVCALADANTLVVANKIDVAPAAPELAGCRVWGISAKTGMGLDGFMAELAREVMQRLGGVDTAAPAVTRARHREALVECVAALERARGGREAELIAEDLRLASRALGRITGRVGVEDVLDLIFREFCIGK